MAAVSDSTDNLTPRRTRMRAAVAISAVIHVVVLSVALAWWNRPDPLEAPLTQGITVDLVPPTGPLAEKKPEPPSERQPPLVPPKISSSILAPPPAAPSSPAPPPPPPERAPAKPPEPEATSTALKPIAPEWTEPPGESPPPAAAKTDPVLPDPEVVEQMSRLNRPGEFDALAEAKAKLSAEEVAAFRQQIRKCWTRPAALANAQRLQATVRVVLRNDGSLRGEPILVQAPAAALGPLLVKTAIAAVRQCQPYTMLPRAKYAEWQVLDLRFTPDGPLWHVMAGARAQENLRPREGTLVVSNHTSPTLRPLRIQLHEADNVAIVVNGGGLPAGTVFDDGLTLIEHVPQGHKVALADIAAGDPIRRYGSVIGYAERALPKGSWIDEFKMRMPPPPPLDALPVATAVPAPLPPLTGFTFEGYRNDDGSVGTRNVLGISTSVQCVAGTTDHIVRLVKEKLLPRYPHVDDVVALNHTYGCGVAINSPMAIIPIRTLQNIALNPNFGGEILVIGLGCEKLQPEQLLPADRDGDTSILRLQDERFEGFGAMVDEILAMVEERLEKLNRRRRETCPAADLVVGLQCGGSDAFSGVTANPAIGYCADLLVRAGATVMFSEVTEVRDAIHLLTPRAATPEIGRALIREMAWYDAYLASADMDRASNTSPGNKKGGLANIVEKALGSAAKSGTSAISGVLGPGEKATQKGLLFAATPASDFICGTLQLASGMTLQVFSTGRGTPYGLAAAPVIKVSTRKELKARWHDLIDLDAGRIATGEATIEEIGWELFRLILDVASGRTKPWSDRFGLHNALTLFNPGPVT